MVLVSIIFLCLIYFISGLVSFVISRKHLILVLISLEFMVLGMYFFMLVLFGSNNFCLLLSVVFLVMSVCGGSLGLSVLICLVRTHGSDLFLVGSLLNC